LITRRQLRDSGITDRQIAAAVAEGTLTRVRRGLFADALVPVDLRTALAAGGRLACASELRRLGVWVLDDRIHVHFEQSPARLRHGVRHWRQLIDPPGIGSVSPLDAAFEALECLERRAALAALDSALHLGIVTALQVADLPLTRRARRIAELADGRAESGLESLARLLAIDLGLTTRSQVEFDGIGRVDLVVQGAIVIEADGDEFHSNAVARRRDRRRDAQLAAIGRPVLRFGYEQLVGRPGEVARAIIRTVAGHRAVKNSREVADRALRRAKKRGWA
jgi:very-short-patch-repair endonuclease